MILAADRLDDFLAEAGSGTELGERLETIGLLLSLPGILVAVGLIAFIRFVHREGSPEERWSIMRVLATCALLVLIGGLGEWPGREPSVGGPGSRASLPARAQRSFGWRRVL